ncbi:peptidase U32 family protein [Dendrosporobacter sp. 1207_IL3150]|uniref:peptidase U32 family protein n=1 Tax=Dendrosporobacter sp. 1207_IL3150 TaxID=3084054 RepID=UPI002FDAAB29
MLLSRDSVELLAPVGTWEVLETAVGAGADAVYLGGKRFNMRMHRTDTNFDDAGLARAVKFAHGNNVKLYVTVNNLISDREIDGMRDYLKLLDEIQPDALIVQDLAVLELASELNLTVPLHASVMANTHNEYAVRKLQEYGITRVVVSREMTLAQMALLKDRTGIEIEYFMHGDMCVAQSGQCFHSGILFGQSSNRGRCLKPCRWPFQLMDTSTGQAITNGDPGPYKLALKDMCMYRNLPELIQSGVCSFKIEGRMRTADFVKRIVQVYRRAIDRYIADPMGYTTDEHDWADLYENRSRDFTTCYALGNPGAASIGYTGEREPRFFSQAVKEAGLNAPAAVSQDSNNSSKPPAKLSVRVSDMAGLTAACENGADIIYIGGEAFKPAKPWTIGEISEAIEVAAKYNVKVVVTTPRITMERESNELEQFFTQLNQIRPHGVMVSNIGMLKLAKETCDLPVQTDFSLNTFNHLSTKWLKNNGAAQATISLEATHEQVGTLISQSDLPLELIVHGPIEAMVLDHCIPTAIVGYNFDNSNELNNKQFELLDTAGQKHPIRIDQYGRNHILFAKDLCLLSYLPALQGAASYRIEAQHYSPELVGVIVKAYREQLDKQASGQTEQLVSAEIVNTIAAASPRDLGIGAFRYRVSR